jgi:hypothetical protein
VTENANQRNPIKLYDQINPIKPFAPSTKWSQNDVSLSKGFNEDDLKTYIIRKPDILQAQLFDRHILKDHQKMFPKRETLGQLIANRYPRTETPGSSPSEIKQMYRNMTQGNTQTNPM